MSAVRTPILSRNRRPFACWSIGASLVVLFLSGAAPAQDWAKEMFAETSKDFGTVAKGAKTEHRFVFRNRYKEDVHVVGVRTSCGCTTPSVTKKDLKTHETSEIVAVFNTKTFVGQHGATLTVTFDKPFRAEVQLRVTGNIRGEVTFEPPFIDLGNVDLGKGVERTVRVTHLGSTPWEIKDVRSVNSNYVVSLSPPRHTGAQSIYDLTLRLRPDCPAGDQKGELLLVTNDARAKQIPMEVQGRVVAEVTVSPQLLALGSVQPGGSVTKNVVVRANRPFKVTGVECGPDGCITCSVKDAHAPVHILPVTFQAGETSGKIERLLKITTDLGAGVVPAVTVQATVEGQPEDAAPADAPQADAARTSAVVVPRASQSVAVGPTLAP